MSSRIAELLLEALTHRSWVNEHPGARDNEALAFVGDAVLGLVVAEHLASVEPAAAVGVLTPRRADLVSGASLARWAERLALGECLRLGRGEARDGRARQGVGPRHRAGGGAGGRVSRGGPARRRPGDRGAGRMVA